MTIREIGYYSAVTTPAVSDEFLCQKNGASQKTTTTEILDAISDFTQYDKDDLIASGIVMGTQSDAQVKISLAQIIAYAKTIAYGMIYAGYTTTIVKTCEAYSVSAKTWAAKADLPTPVRIGHAASTISNKGYVYGGETTAYSKLQDCDEYAFGSPGTWTSKTSFSSTARSYLSASTILGKGYIYGGNLGVGLCDEFDASGNSWVANKDTLNTERSYTAATTILDKGYVFGGANRSTVGDPLSSLRLQSFEQYNSITDEWTTMGNYSTPARNLHAAFTLLDKGYICGGTNQSSAPLEDCDYYDPGTEAWAAAQSFTINNPFVFAMYGLSGTSILGKGYLFGGNISIAVKTSLKYYPKLNSWAQLGNLSTATYYLAASSLHS